MAPLAPSLSAIPRRIFITGGAGFVGAALAAALTESGRTVCLYDNLSNYSVARLDAYGINAADIVAGDVIDSGRFQQAVAQFAPDAIIHLAATHYIPDCDADPVKTRLVNVAGTDNVVAAAASLPNCHVVFASSAAVYADISSGILSEDSSVEPVSVYGQTKLQAEQLVKDTLTNYTILRLFNVYGPYDSTPHLIPKLMQHSPRQIVGLGNQLSRRDYIFTSDVVAAFMAALTSHRRGETYNVGTGRAYSVAEVVKAWSALLDDPLQVQYQTGASRTHDTPLLRADVTKLRFHTDWYPKTSLQAGLAALHGAQQAGTLRQRAGIGR